jgi:hypothetical protein
MEGAGPAAIVSVAVKKTANRKNSKEKNPKSLKLVLWYFYTTAHYARRFLTWRTITQSALNCYPGFLDMFFKNLSGNIHADALLASSDSSGIFLSWPSSIWLRGALRVMECVACRTTVRVSLCSLCAWRSSPGTVASAGPCGEKSAFLLATHSNPILFYLR